MRRSNASSSGPGAVSKRAQSQDDRDSDAECSGAAAAGAEPPARARGRQTTCGSTRLVHGLRRRVAPGGVDFDDSFAGSTRTNASGAFSFRKRITRITGFFAYVPDVDGTCAG